MKTEHKDYANAILLGLSLQSDLEDYLDEILGGDGVEKMWFDTYDASIEICVSKDCKTVNEALMTKLSSHGFTTGWVNFSDGTEQAFYQGKLGERKPVQHPRWTEERRNKEYLGIAE